MVGRGAETGENPKRLPNGEAAARIVRAAGSSRDRADLLHAIVVAASEIVGVDRCVMFLRPKNTTKLFRGVAALGALVDGAADGLICGGLADRFSREIIASRGPVVVENAAHDARAIRPTMRQFEVTDVLGVPMIAADEVDGLLFVEQHGSRRSYSDQEQQDLMHFGAVALAVVLQFDAAAELREANARLDRRAATLGRAAVIDRRFTSLSSTTPDADGIAALTARLTEKQCSVATVEGVPVAQASPDGVSALVSRVLAPQITAQPEVAEALAAIAPGRSAIVGANVNCNLLHRSLVAPVTVDDATWGYIAIMESRSRLTLTDQAVVERAARALELELRVDRRIAAAGLGGGVLRTDYDATQLQRTMDEHLGPLPAALVVCRVEPRGTATPSGTGEIAAAFSSHYGTAPLLTHTSVDAVSALVVGLPEGISRTAGCARVADALEAALRELPDPDAHFAAVSTARRSPDDVHHAFEEARQVAHAVTSLCSEVVLVVSASALGVGRLVLGAVDRCALERFVTLELAALTTDGRDPREAELLRTLYVFIESSRSPRLAAQALNVHENTVRYRLRTIAHLTGLDVAGDAQDQLTAQMAMLVLRLQGRLPGYDPLGRPVPVRRTAP
ncbi:GAF domain-containing protein [Patulibacter sp. NPDC049589]|uniref:helix-turn-helix domain-containing protein n=1 Tax=Patulibacter sp. NPDC049589 TaxID=3154731 RepID=UPI00343365D8